MKITDIGSFYLVEDNDKYYLSTVHSQYNGYEDEEDVSCNEITKEVYDAMLLTPPNYVKTPKHVETEVLKTLHSKDEFPANRRWLFNLGEEQSIFNNKSNYDTIYNDEEPCINIHMSMNGNIFLSLAESLYLDLDESYKSICKKVKFIRQKIEIIGIVETEKYLYSLEQPEIEEEIKQWEE